MLHIILSRSFYISRTRETAVYIFTLVCGVAIRIRVRKIYRVPYRVQYRDVSGNIVVRAYTQKVHIKR